MRAYEPSGDQLTRLKLLAVFESNFRALPTLSIRMIVPLFPTARIVESFGLYEAQRRCSLVWDVRSLNLSSWYLVICPLLPTSIASFPSLDHAPQRITDSGLTANRLTVRCSLSANLTIMLPGEDRLIAVGTI